MKEKDLVALENLLANIKTAVVIPHKNPDGDAMGSSLAWHRFLVKKNIDSVVVTPNDYPEFLKWLPDSHTVICFENEASLAQEKLLNAGAIFTLDFNSLGRIETLGDFVADCEATKVMIDHHQSPEDYADIRFSEPSIGSTCELVYNIINQLGTNDIIDSQMATCLYVGIMTDTGSFRFPSVSAQTHLAVADLIGKGVLPDQCYNKIHDTATYSRLQLLGQALNNLVVLPEYQTAYMTLSQEELNRFQFKKGDTEGFVNYGLSIAGVRFAVIMIENKQDAYTKLSLRSTGSFSVNEFARDHFQGGGHRNAAGGRNDGTIEDTVHKLRTLLPHYQNALQQP